MKVGDLVKDNHPVGTLHSIKFGVIIGRTRLGTSSLNKTFKVLWRDGTIGNNVWDYDLKVVNESRRFSSVDRA